MSRLLLAGLLALGCAANPSTAQIPARLTAAAFGNLVQRLSETGGYFDTDNLVSNEDSYLHAVTGLERYGVTGGAYIGVGPDQSFSYIAAIRPRIAFLIDIRRDNLLEHLLFKALFVQARNRIEYLCMLFGKPAPGDSAGWAARDLGALVDYVARTSADSAAAAGALSAAVAALRVNGVSLSAADLQTINRFHRTFIAEGLDLKLTTFGRPERYDYPTYRDLLLQTDLAGRRANFLASEASFRIVKSLEDRNLVIPVVGDLAGPKSLMAIGRYLTERGEHVAAFYTSNVEQYLFRGGRFGRFADNVAALPEDDHSVIIRSYFSYGVPHPQAVPGYLSVQLLQRFGAFLAARKSGGYASYVDLVTRDALAPR